MNKHLLIKTNSVNINGTVICYGKPIIDQQLVGIRVDQVSTGEIITTSIVVEIINTPDPRWVVVKTMSGNYYSVILLPDKIS